MTQIISTFLAELLTKQKEELEKTRNLAIKQRLCIKIDLDSFKELIKINCDIIIAQRNIFKRFEFNSNNLPVVEQLHLHFSGNTDFNGELYKGIMLVGKNGVGKTLLLKSYCIIRAKYFGMIPFTYSSKFFVELIKENGFNEYKKRELLIDDLGKESRELIDFGNRIQPMADLISYRYDLGTMTFITSNYNMNTLTEYYGLTTTDRLKEMVNVIEFKGESLR